MKSKVPCELIQVNHATIKIDCYDEAVKEFKKKQKAFHESSKQKKRYVLYGNSRGAAVVLVHRGLYPSQDIAALVCEAPFDCLENTALHSSFGTKVKMSLLKKISSVKKTMRKIRQSQL